MKFIGTISELAIPYILAYLIDTVVPKDDRKMIVILGIAMIICAIFALVFNIFANRIAAIVARRTTTELRHDLFEKIMHLSCAQIDTYTTPSVISRLTSNTYDVNHMIGVFQRMGVRAPILLIGGIIITLTLDIPLTLILIATLPFIIISVYFVSKKGIPEYTKTYQISEQMIRTVRENISGIRVVKALSKSEYEKERFDTANKKLSRQEKKASSIMALSNPLMNLFFNLGLVAVLFVGAYRVNSGLIKIGNIIAFMTYFTLILNALMSLTRLFVIYSKSMASSRRIFEVLNTPIDIKITQLPNSNTEYHIEFRDVSFSYLKRQNNLSNISFAIKRGETLGIIGNVGSGKTTIINLLLRLYDNDKGEIYINNQNIKSIPFEKLYNYFGIVFQNDILFADTIKNNIDLFKGNSMDKLIDAAESAQAFEFINAFPNTFDHRIAIKGSDLSGGQKQRLLITRSLSKNAEIIILDDSSSALDYKTDSLLRKAIKQKFDDATKIIIAQRISSIIHSDKILVIDEGNILGYGNHNQLISSCSFYQEIFDIQMGGKR